MEQIVKKAFIHFNNDPSVGMFAFGYEMEIHLINPDENELSEIRAAISNLYELTEGEKPSWVMFDFELKEEHEQQEEFEAQEAKLWEEESQKRLDEEFTNDNSNFLADNLEPDVFERANQRALRNYI